MAPKNNGGVVDEKLGVYGVEWLKVADLSVVPVNMAANTGNMAFTIGEKAAYIFVKELECSKRSPRGNWVQGSFRASHV